MVVSTESGVVSTESGDVNREKVPNYEVHSRLTAHDSRKKS